jgi:hypothetical protein
MWRQGHLQWQAVDLISLLSGLESRLKIRSDANATVRINLADELNAYSFIVMAKKLHPKSTRHRAC